MEIVLAIIGIILILLIITMRNEMRRQFDSLDNTFENLRDEIRVLKERISPLPIEKKPDIQAAKQAEVKASPIVEPKKEVVEHKQPVEKPIEHQQVSAPKIAIPEFKKIEEKPRPEPVKPGFFERNPDLEKFIGENLANKIGIAILVLGIGFFVKYAIDQNWINEIGRVFIGILCGGLLLGVAHWLRKTFTAFSSVLVGGGIAVLYLTIAIAFHQYHLFGQTAAFAIMVVITGFSVIFSLGYNRKELAVLSLLGGFASPFMVSTGEGNYIVLFTYILILDVGMLILAYYKKWNLINAIAYVATTLLYGSWLFTHSEKQNAGIITGGLIFATLFYFVFFAMNLINNIRKRLAFKTLEITLLLSNTFLFYAAGMHLLNQPPGDMYRGLFTASLALFNFIFAFTLYKSKRVDSKVVFLLIGLVLTFASLAAPVQLKGNYITLFWGAEAALLLWLSQKSGIRLMKLTSVIVLALMILSLVIDWFQIYGPDSSEQLPIVINKGYITSLFSLTSLVICFYLSQFDKTENRQLVEIYKRLVGFACLVVLYVSQLLELFWQVNIYVDDYYARNLIIGTYNMVFISGMLAYSKKAASNIRAVQIATLFGMFGLMIYLFAYNSFSIHARDGFLSAITSGTGFFFHYLLLAVTLIVALLTLTNVQTFSSFNKQTNNSYSWLFVSFFLFLASAELDNLVVWIGYTDVSSLDRLLTQNHKIGYPILWGLSSFGLIAFGLKWKKRHMRIISLTLFLITLLKLFLIDIRGISEGGKIAAFISLGILLLIVSFMYQRIKKVLLKDETITNENQ